MDDGVVFVDVNGGNVLGSGSGEGDDVGEKFIGPDLHGVVKQRVLLPIA